jgi:hypothetical protein
VEGNTTMTKAATYVDAEENAYHCSFGRKGRAIVRQNPHNPIALPYGEVRAVRAGIPDTYYSIPALLRVRGKTVKGYLSSPYDGEEGVLYFTPEADPAHCHVCASGEGCKR